jgi:salicylate hydroxylase
VTGVDTEELRVKLSTGEVLTGDVIVGADGVKGLCRPMVLEEGVDDAPNHRYNYYA